MKDQSFTATLSVAQTPKEAFDAILNVRGWWSENIEGGTGKLGDEFTYRYKDVHRCKMKLILRSLITEGKGQPNQKEKTAKPSCLPAAHAASASEIVQTP